MFKLYKVVDGEVHIKEKVRPDEQDYDDRWIWEGLRVKDMERDQILEITDIFQFANHIRIFVDGSDNVVTICNYEEFFEYPAPIWAYNIVPANLIII